MERPPRQTASVDVNLVGSGKSLAAAIASATGHVNVVVGAGQLSEEITRHLPLGSVLMTVLNTISEVNKAKTGSQLECAVLHLEVADGIGTGIKGMALRTDSVNELGAGTVNLTSGDIDLQFKTAQRKGLGISIMGLADNFIRLTGTLAQPKVDLNVGAGLSRTARRRWRPEGSAWSSSRCSPASPRSAILVKRCCRQSGNRPQKTGEGGVGA